MVFENRVDAGRRLAAAVERYRDRRPVVLALPRGGVPVAKEVAVRLEAPLDLVLTRKIGAPMQPELAMGAIAEGAPPIVVRNEDLIRALRVSDAEFDAVRDREAAEIERRRLAYLGDRPRVDVKDRCAIVVDDGIATGMTMRAALKAVAAHAPSELVLAVPVASSETLAAMRGDVADAVCVNEVEELQAIGFHYDDFTQVSDDEVRKLLETAG